MRVAHELIVVLIHASTGAQEWKGSLADFFEANRDALDVAERLLVLKILNQGAVYFFGGGASPLMHLKLHKPLGVQAAEVIDPPDIIAEEQMEAEAYDRAEARRQGLDEISTDRYLTAMRKSRQTPQGEG